MLEGQAVRESRTRQRKRAGIKRAASGMFASDCWSDSAGDSQNLIPKPGCGPAARCVILYSCECQRVDAEGREPLGRLGVLSLSNRQAWALAALWLFNQYLFLAP